MAIIRRVIHAFDWAEFVFGILLNGILIRLILRHTPKIMQIYSKILLQTCITDLLMVITTLLFHHYSLTSQKGEQEIISDGLFTINGTESIWWRLFGSACWFYLIYVALFGFLAQFIYRYLALNWNKKLSPFKYFLLFGVIQLFPMAYCAIFYWRMYPSDGHNLLEDQSIADILGLNLTETNVVIIGYVNRDYFMLQALYYIIILCSIAYAIIFTLAYLMHRFLRERFKIGASSVLTDKMNDMNKQISRNLIIQASLPLIVWFSLVFLQVPVVFGLDIRASYWYRYFNIAITIPMTLPAVINPIVSMFVINFYRRALQNGIKKIVSDFCQRTTPTTTTQMYN